MAALKIVMAIINLRIGKGTSRPIDMQMKSFLPNLRRAYVFRKSQKMMNENSENFILTIIKANPHWFDFRTKPWRNIRHANLPEINFPSVSYSSNEEDLYNELNPSHIYHMSLGNYAIKRGLNYLNSPEYEQNCFELQFLPLESDYYRVIQRQYFPSLPIRIIRFKVQSYHKKSFFNQKGYRGYIAYIPVTHFDPLRNDRFRLLGNSTVSNLNDSNFYFKNSIKGHFCTCKTGARMVGCCSHIIAAILGFGCPSDFSKERYLPQTPASFAFPQYDSQ